MAGNDISISERVVTAATDYGRQRAGDMGSQVGENAGNAVVQVAQGVLAAIPLPPTAKKAAAIVATVTAPMGPPAVIFTGIAFVFGLVVDAASGNLD